MISKGELATIPKEVDPGSVSLVVKEVDQSVGCRRKCQNLNKSITM